MKKLLLIFILFSSYCFGQGTVPVAQTISNAVTYTLPTDELVTSAGIYTMSGILVRTLWSNKPGAAGVHTAIWDGRDDDGNLMTIGVTYQIKIASNNNVYLWEGVIGNTSIAQTGTSVWRGGYQPGDMAETGGYMRVATGFSERDVSQCKFLESSPQAKIVYSNQPNAIGQASTNTCANSTNIFWGGWDYTGSHTYVFAENVSNDAETTFSAGVNYTAANSRTYNTLDLGTSTITGLAVQNAGSRYLLVAHASINTIDEFITSTTGALVRTISITSPGKICLENDNTLWVTQGTTATKYTVNSDGTIISTGSQITGLSNAVGISTHSGELAILDAGTQQVPKFYNSTTLAPITKGTWVTGGYASSPTVTNNKFYIQDVRGQLITFITYDSSGGFWIGDAGNCRAQHYNSSGTFIESIMYIPTYVNYLTAGNNAMVYNVNICGNLNTSVFGQLLEFNIDYTQPLSTGWTLVNNYGYNLPSGWVNNGLVGSISVLSNGRKYALLTKGGSGSPYMSELTSSGLRIINTLLPGFCSMDANGNLFTITKNNAAGNASTIYKKQALTGFDGAGNPQWGSVTTVATVATGYQEPLTQQTLLPITTSNKLIILDPTTSIGRQAGLNYYHIGAYDATTFQRLWRTSKANFTAYGGDFPTDGTSDVGNSVKYPWGTITTVGNEIFANYHGENWKKAQTNMIYMYNDIGLLEGLFGVLGVSVAGQTAPFAFAGNSLNTNATSYGGNYYLYFSDEGKHAGYHRWKISNTSSENIVTVNIPLNNRVYTPTINKIDLLANVPNGQVSVSGLSGWTQTPTSDVINNVNPNATGQFYSKSRLNIFDYSKSADVQFYASPTSKGNRQWKVALPSNPNWSVTGNLDLTVNSFIVAESSSAKVYLEVTDNAGKAISRIYLYNSNRIQFNSVFYGPYNQNKVNSSDFVIKRVSGTNNVFFSINLWGTQVGGIQAMQDPTADITHPASISINLIGNTNNAGFHIGINELFEL